MRMRRVLAATAFLFTAAAALDAAEAATITIDLPSAADVQTITAHYQCGTMAVTVDYINAGNVSLAVLHLPDEIVVAANVLSGSGARYAGGKYIWWSTGNDATLADLTAGGEDSPTQCTGTD
jgi:membrane-bound inhibitor of C-type lysozyme